eukprot:scaffold154396_cov73-Cyclotella_meneghiniana.AAC.3
MTAREDALAHVLHIFSSSSTTSPLIKRDDGSVCLVESDVQQPRRLICNVQMRSGSDWLNQIVLQLQVSSTAADTNVDVVMKSMLDMSAIDSVEDDIIWAAGLKLIHCITSQDIFYKYLSNEPIEPHILISTLMDSYYHGDEDYQIDERNSNTRQLSVPQAMFQLRSVLATIAIEHAVDLTRKAIEKKETVRWRRLRSMTDDAISLFRKMSLNQLENACESGSTNESQDVIAMAVYIFVNSMFPTCRDLLQLLLENAKDTQFTMRILQTSYSCIGMLTSLASLQFIFGDGELISYIMKCIDDSNNLFKMMLDKHAFIAATNQHRDKATEFCLLGDIALNKCERGSNLLDDLILHPSICVEYAYHANLKDQFNNEDSADDSDESSGFNEVNATYDLLGVAVIAYYSLQNLLLKCQRIQRKERISFLAHVHIFLSGIKNNSAIVVDLNKDELDETKAIETGLDMLVILMPSDSEDVPEGTCFHEKEIICHAMTLEATIESLLSTVMRLSMFEASIHSNAHNTNTLKYSSRRVMSMAHKLIRLYKPIIQIRTLASLSYKVKNMEHTKVLLPRILDWMRPVVMTMHLNIQQQQLQLSGVDVEVLSSENINVILAVTDAISPFFRDLEVVFDNTTPPLPKNILEFMSMAESYTSLLSVFRSIRIFLSSVQTVTPNNTAEQESLQQIKRWAQEILIVLNRFKLLLADLLDFWSRACSPRDAKVCIGDIADSDLDPPIGWHRLHILLHALGESLISP